MRKVSVCLALAVMLSLSATAWPSPRGMIKNAKHVPGAITPVNPEQQMETYPVLGPDGAQIGSAEWRVVTGTGNCCENYLAVSADGRLVDFGGTLPVYTDDAGVTWNRVEAPLFYGEGAIAAAPGGDLVGVSWDAYGGDKLFAFKYTSTTDSWEWVPIAVHAPFYDRPWISVIPGPFIGTDAPYVSILRGAFPYKEPMVSEDGLNYERFEVSYLSEVTNGYSEMPSTTADPDNDWTQPLAAAGVSALGGGRALFVPQNDSSSSCAPLAMEPDFTWRCVQGQGSWSVTDSAGRLHQTYVVDPTVGDRLNYVVTSASGAHTVSLPLPRSGDFVRYVDLKANAALGTAVVAVHTTNTATEKDGDYLFKLDISGQVPVLTKIMQVGDADVQAYYWFDPACELELVGLYDCPDARFDFTSVVIMPNGKLAVGFIDSQHLQPALAIEQ